jgi:hypothetical protein
MSEARTIIFAVLVTFFSGLLTPGGAAERVPEHAAVATT